MLLALYVAQPLDSDVSTVLRPWGACTTLRGQRFGNVKMIKRLAGTLISARDVPQQPLQKGTRGHNAVACRSIDIAIALQLVDVHWSSTYSAAVWAHGIIIHRQLASALATSGRGRYSTHTELERRQTDARKQHLPLAERLWRRM